MDIDDLVKRVRDNDIEAMLKLHEILCNENATYKDMQDNYVLVKRAAELDPHNHAVLKRLGDCYFYGYGVEQSIKIAIKYYEDASMQGSVDASYLLATLYYQDSVVKKDLNNALLYFKKAAEQGSEEALKYVEELSVNNNEDTKEDQTSDHQKNDDDEDDEKKSSHSFIKIMTSIVLIAVCLYFAVPVIQTYITDYMISKNVVLYKGTLVGFVNKDNESRFLLANLDEDNIPELFVATSNREGCPVFVYTVKDKKVVELISTGKYGKIDVAHNNNMLRSKTYSSDKDNVNESTQVGSTIFISYNNDSIHSYDFKYDNENKEYYVNDKRNSQDNFFNELSRYDNYDFSEISYSDMKNINSSVLENLKKDYKNYLFLEDEEKVNKTGWDEKVYKHYFYYIEGNALKGLHLIENDRYYFNELGIMETGFQKADNNTYYFDESGKSVTGMQTIDEKTYFFSEEGKMFIDAWNEKYYFDENGEMAIGVKSIKDKTYYFDENGVMQSDFMETIDDKTYYFSSEGPALTGRNEIEGEWYYFDSEGVMQTGMISDQGVTYYYLEDIGTMMKNYWFDKNQNETYYFDEEGVMVTNGFHEIKGNNYYFEGTGAILKNEKRTIDNKTYIFDGRGVMQTGWTTFKGDKYYLDSEGVVLTGIRNIGGRVYNLGNDGVLKK